MATDNVNSIKGILPKIDQYRYNPSGIQRVSLQYLRDIRNGDIDIVDATNPFVFLSESSAVNTAAFMIENAANNRKQYASAAQTVEDLYLHMSDKDYIDRFASPSMTRFSILIDKDELENKLVLDPATGIKKVTIPRNSEFIVGGVVFSLQYPIDIKQFSHGGWQVVYDNSIESPLQKLETNVVQWSERTNSSNQQKVLYLEFDVFQFSIVTTYGDLNNVTGYNKLLPFSDEYYFARVYHKSSNTNDEWAEMYTTHTDQVYDHTKPTAVLKVLNGGLQVTVPQVYFTTDQVAGSIRVDIYQTKGEVSMILENYKPSAFEANWKAIDRSEINGPVAALQSIQSIFVYSTHNVAGGKPSLSFEELRTRVIKNAIGSYELPVTNVQIESSLQNKGYQVVKNIDSITNRTFLATKALPRPKDERLITAGATSIETLVISMEQAVTHPGTRNNGQRITLTPDILYTNNNGMIRPVDNAVVQALKLRDPESLATAVTTGKYLYTPFHYVMDATQDAFDVRPYYLDHPVAQTCQFITQNDTTGMQVNTYRYSLSKTSAGYKLLIETKSNETYRDLDDSLVHAQLSFIPENEENRCYLQGTLIGKTAKNERVFEFQISTAFDIDHKDNIWLKSFQMFTTGARSLSTPLLKDFDIFYSTSVTLGPEWNQHMLDSEIGRFLLPNRIAAITHEKVRLKFGVPLKNLWASNRSLPASAPFQVYEQDVYETYKEDVYDKDPVTGSIFSINNGALTYNLKYRKGDTVVNQNTGMPMIKHRRGDVKLDISGKPIATGPNLVTRQIDVMFIEGAYYFATDIASANYRESIVSTVVDWITIDLKEMSTKLLEQTKLFFYPKTTMGSVNVMIENGISTVIEAGQYFNVKLYVNDVVFENAELREALTVNTVKVIDNQLKNSTVSISTITSALKDSYKNDVIALSINGLGGTRNLQMLTVLNEGDRCSIRKRLTALPDGKLIVQEDVVVDFIRHEQNV